MVEELLEETSKDAEVKSTLERAIEDLNGQSATVTPKHLSNVHAAHLLKLNGFNWMFKTLGNGRCLENSVAVHTFENEDEGETVKEMLNYHIAENWDNFY